MVRKTPLNRSNLPFWAAAYFKFMHSTFWTMRGGKRKKTDDATCPIFDNFLSKFLFKSVGRQLATFARILVAKYFFH